MENRPPPPRRPDVNPPDAHRNDLGLVQAVLERKADAVVELVHRLGCVPRFVAARNQQLGRPLTDVDLEDVVQDVLVIIWRKLPDFHGRTSLDVWVYRICCYELLNAIRRRGGGGRERSVPSDDVPTRSVDLSREEDRGERHEKLYAALDRLTDEEREIVRLKHFDNLSFTEIGESVGLSPNTAKTRYYRGIRRLVGFLGGDEARGEGAA